MVDLTDVIWSVPDTAFGCSRPDRSRANLATRHQDLAECQWLQKFTTPVPCAINCTDVRQCLTSSPIGVFLLRLYRATVRSEED